MVLNFFDNTINVKRLAKLALFLSRQAEVLSQARFAEASRRISVRINDVIHYILY